MTPRQDLYRSETTSDFVSRRTRGGFRWKRCCMNSNVGLDPFVRCANFESLQQTFFFETGAVGAARMVRPYGSFRRLNRLLRHHTTEAVSDLAEIHLRDLFDSLLGFYSLVEIGAQVGA